MTAKNICHSVMIWIHTFFTGIPARVRASFQPQKTMALGFGMFEVISVTRFGKRFVTKWAGVMDGAVPVKIKKRLHLSSITAKVCFASVFMACGIISASSETINVSSYGATGDCQQVWIRTTAGSPIISFTNHISSANIGDTVEIFGCGPTNIGLGTATQTIVTSNQDYIGIIQSIDGTGTNATISADSVFNWANTNGTATHTVYPQVTMSAAFCIYGTNNANAFQTAVANLSSNGVLYVPRGSVSAWGTTNAYLLIPSESYSNWNGINNSGDNGYHARLTNSALIFFRGGFWIEGDGRGQTILKGQGAWKAQLQYTPYGCYAGDPGGMGARGTLIEWLDPVVTNYPVIITNLTLDAGVPVGLNDNYNTLQPDSYVDGLGWDQMNHCLEFAPWTGEPGLVYCKCDTVEFDHCRGEMVLNDTGTATTEMFVATNFNIWDGEASGFNTEVAYDIENGTFSNLLFGFELNTAAVTNHSSILAGCLFTNMLHSFGTFDGGTSSNLPVGFSNNICMATGNPNGLVPGEMDGIQVTPLSNLSIQNNVLTGSNAISYITLNLAGFFGTAESSNIWISGNHVSFYQAGQFIVGANGYNLVVSNNTLDANNFSGGQRSAIFQGQGLITNVTFIKNNFTAVDPQISAGDNVVTFSSAPGGIYALISTNTTYQYNYNQTLFSWGHNNIISYQTGPWYQITDIPYSDQTFILSTSDGAEIPNGAEIALDTTVNSGFTTATVYFASNTNTSGSFFMSGPGVYGFYYNAISGLWQTSPVGTLLIPPIGSPGSTGAGF